MNDIVIKDFDNVRIMVLSEQGENHIKKDICNQDSYSFKVDGYGNYAFAVADGVSTCVFAKEGADKACEVVCNMLSDCVDLSEDEVKQKIFSNWKNLVVKNWDDYGTTINFLYVYPEKIVAGKIGDGSVIVKNGDELFFKNDESIFYTSDTFAFGRYIYKHTFKVDSIKRNISLPVLSILLTDGITKELEPEKIREFSDYIDLAIKKPNFVVELKDWVKGLNKKNGDDKTILICKIEGR